MVEGSGLENRRGETHRGFESLLLRQTNERARGNPGIDEKSREKAGALAPRGLTERASRPGDNLGCGEMAERLKALPC